MLNLKLPMQTKDGKPVTIVTTEGRNPEYPILGYIGDEVDLTEWRADGTPRYNYISDKLENVPLTGEAWVVIRADGDVTIDNKEFVLEYVAELSRPPLAVIRLPYSATPGRRDDLAELPASVLPGAQPKDTNHD